MLRITILPPQFPERERPYFDRFDICVAYMMVEQDWNHGGWLRERPTNQRRRQSIGVQLTRMRFRPGAAATDYASMSENAQLLYDELELRYNLNRGRCVTCGRRMHTPHPSQRCADYEEYDAYANAESARGR